MTRIVAVLTDPENTALCLDAARVAASALPVSQVEAFHPRLRPECLILPTEEVMTERRRAALTAMLDRQSQAIHTAANAAGEPLLWHEAEGDSVAALVAGRGRTADLVVLVRPADPAGEEALHAAVFETGRLLLLVPPGAPAPFGRHIAIAWKASRQASAAVMAAVPWLKRAQRISLLLADSEPPSVSAVDEVMALLHPHGITADPVLIGADDSDLGARLLHEAHTRGADSLVMGAYRHNRLIEMIVGGVTRHMLAASDVPVFMLH